MPPQNYRRYIKSQIAKENDEELKSDANIVYEELMLWINRKKLSLDKRLIRDILFTCNRLITSPRTSVDAEKIDLECFLTYTREQKMNTIATEILRELNDLEYYVKEVYPIMQIRLDVESRYSHKSLRIRQLDALDLVKLFDEILNLVKDKNLKTEIENIMNKFVANNLYDRNEYI